MLKLTDIDKFRYGVASVLALAFIDGLPFVTTTLVGRTAEFVLLFLFFAPLFGWPQRTRDLLLAGVLYFALEIPFRRFVPLDSPIRPYITLIVLGVFAVMLTVRRLRVRGEGH